MNGYASAHESARRQAAHGARVRTVTVPGEANGVLKRHHRAGDSHERQHDTEGDTHQPMGLKPEPASHALADGRKTDDGELTRSA